MRENRLRTLWKSGGAAVNGWLAIPNSFSAETMAHQGWDSLTIDLQHGVVDYQAMVGMLQAISTTDTVPVVRVPWLEPGILMKTLDAGAYGVICPMVNTREDAQKPGRLDALRAARHAQLRPGARAALRRRRLPAARQRHHRHLRDDRDRAGARQPRRHPVGRRASTRSTSARRTCRWRSAARPVVRRRRPEGGAGHRPHPRARQGARRGRRHPQRHAPKAALARIAKGFQFVTVSSDARLMAAGAQQVMAKMRAAPAARAPAPTPTDHATERNIDMKIGFIGLGIMGAPMALHLIDAGHELFVHTRSKVPDEHRRDVGDRVRRRSAEVARAGRGRLPHGARHARRRGGAVRRGRRGRRPARQRQDRGRHELDLADRRPRRFAQEDQRRSAATTSTRRSRAARSAPRRQS